MVSPKYIYCNINIEIFGVRHPSPIVQFPQLQAGVIHSIPIIRSIRQKPADRLQYCGPQAFIYIFILLQQSPLTICGGQRQKRAVNT